jgi:imidazolonepropionase-like amidohydrolase
LTGRRHRAGRAREQDAARRRAVFNGSGAPAADADVLMEDGRILEVGPGLDGDEAVDVSGRHLLPGLFDCHTHVT